MMLKRAYRDTLRQAGGTPGIVLLIAAPVISWLLLRRYGDEAAVADGWMQLLVSLAGFGLVALGMFAWNLGAAPFRIEREKNCELTSRASVLETGANERPRADCVLECNLVVFGGSVRDRAEQEIAVLFLTVRNRGALPSALVNWRMWVDKPDGRTVLGLSHPPGEIELDTPDGLPIQITDKDIIYEKTLTPIPAGGVVSGFILSLHPAGLIHRAPDIFVGCAAEQVDGTVVEGAMPVQGGTPVPVHVPGVNIRRSLQNQQDQSS